MRGRKREKEIGEVCRLSRYGEVCWGSVRHLPVCYRYFVCCTASSQKPSNRNTHCKRLPAPFVRASSAAGRNDFPFTGYHHRLQIFRLLFAGTVIFPLNFLGRLFFGDLYRSFCLSRSRGLGQSRLPCSRLTHPVQTEATMVGGRAAAPCSGARLLVSLCCRWHTRCCSASTAY